MSDSNSLINIGELSKPATVLIEKISDAVGGVFKPFQIKRIAKANAEAKIIEARSEIQISDLQRRAMHRFVEEEAQKQENIESITSKSIPLLKDNAAPENMDNDWVTNFFDKSRIVSDDEMQKLWSRVLAEEANEPGTFSRRTVNLMSDLDKSDADLFTTLCRFCWNGMPFIFDLEHQIYSSHGVGLDSVSHLESLGLVQHFDRGLVKVVPRNARLSYFGSLVELTFPNAKDNDFLVGKVKLTKAGLELEPICGSQPIPGFFEFVRERWIMEKLMPPVTE